MTEPYTPLHRVLIREAAAIRQAEQMARHAEQYIASHMHHQPYHAGRPPKGPDMTALLEDVATKIKDFGARVAADLEDLVATAPPAIHDASEALGRLTSSKIVVELEQLAEPIDPTLEELVAGMIRTAGAAADKVAALTAAATPAPAEPEPSPAGVNTSGIAQ